MNFWWERLNHIWGYSTSVPGFPVPVGIRLQRPEEKILFPLNKSQLSDVTRGRADHIYQQYQTTTCVSVASKINLSSSRQRLPQFKIYSYMGRLDYINHSEEWWRQKWRDFKEHFHPMQARPVSFIASLANVYWSAPKKLSNDDWSFWIEHHWSDDQTKLFLCLIFLWGGKVFSSC